MRVIIDRIEKDIAVCNLENGIIVNAPASLFDNIKEGRVYDIIMNEAEENKRHENAKQRLNSLFNRKGDTI